MPNPAIPNAEVTAIYPNRVKVLIHNIDLFQSEQQQVKVGSYLRITDREDVALIAMVDSFSVSREEEGGRGYLLEANPLGLLKEGVFQRGGGSLAIPPKEVSLAQQEDIRLIFEQSLPKERQFCFASLASDPTVAVPVDGDKFFNKHIAIVGSTGSGKSHSVAKILQSAIAEKGRAGKALNNSHIVIFDIHAEYAAAFPEAHVLDIGNLALPYWLMNGIELEEFFLDTQGNDHNQRSVFKEAVIESKIRHSKLDPRRKERITYDSPVLFELEDVIQAAIEKNEERIPGARGDKAGPLNGRLSNFISRLESKVHDKRLDFLLGPQAKKSSFESVLRQLIGYGKRKSNVTILDLSGIPFDVLSITVSLASRVLFEYGYYYKRLRSERDPAWSNDAPLLLVYEEAHKYVPNESAMKYRASRESIERIAKEGRKYGVSLMLASQRPSEISETIFSQCNNVLALRLTNPADQNYVKRLLPDTLEALTDSMPALKAGECLLIGEATVLPAIVQIELCRRPPASSDIPYWSLWREAWREIDFESIEKLWMDR